VSLLAKQMHLSEKTQLPGFISQVVLAETQLPGFISQVVLAEALWE